LFLTHAQPRRRALNPTHEAEKAKASRAKNVADFLLEPAHPKQKGEFCRRPKFAFLPVSF